MTSFTVSSGQTVSSTEIVNSGGTGTIQSGGVVAVTNSTNSTTADGIDWTGGNAAIVNGGTVIAKATGKKSNAYGIGTSGTISGALTIDNLAGATISAANNDAIRIGNVNGTTWGGPVDISIVNGGLIDSTASANRAINISATSLSDIGSFQLINSAGATIQSQDDAVRVTAGDTGSNTTATGTYSIDNAGTIKTIDAGSGQALDLTDLTSPGDAGTITNEATGVIEAADADAIRPGANAVVNNYGEILSQNATSASSGNDGIDFQSNPGGTVNNYQGGTITGARHGITGKDPVTVVNAGTITGSLGSGINLDTAATTTTEVTNDATGTISGTGGTNGDGSAQDGDGVDVDGLINLQNYGKIEAFGAAVGTGDANGAIQEAVTVGGGTIDNYSGAELYSVQRAITVDNSADGDAFASTNILNQGDIHGTDSAADNGIGAISITGTFANTVTNQGTIEGSILFTNAAGDTVFADNTVTNQGTITGAITFGAGNDTFNAFTGSGVTGTIDGGAGIDVFNLDDGGAGTGTLSNVVNFEILNLNGGFWTIDGTNSFAIGTTLYGGTLELDSDGAVAGGLIQFAAAHDATLGLATGVDLANTIAGFTFGDTIDLAGFDPTTTVANLDPHTDRLSVFDGDGHSISLQLSGDYSGEYFHPGAASGGTDITLSTVACYGRGTLILTDHGEVPVETLAIGDRVITASGVARPIKWIGGRSYGGRFVMGRTELLPICIKAGALGDNVPRRDLRISPRHAMYLEGVLIEAIDLVNGSSIVRSGPVDVVEYFHIELDRHDVILAEGALSETFIDDNSRGIFHNAHEYVALYPAAAAEPAQYCAPRCSGGYEVEAARRRIAQRAAAGAAQREIGALLGFIDVIGPHTIAGWAQNLDHPEAPVCLDIHVGGRFSGRVLANRYRGDLERAGLGSGRHAFEFSLPAGLDDAPEAVEVRRALDGAALRRSA